jgi:glycogen debranching enzyme
MKERGFHVDVHVDGRTGLIIGGNELNCGTWMDKMGSSDKTGNRGIPATSRFGANIEINGLALRVLYALSQWEDFNLPTQLLDWLDRLGDHFDKSFWNENKEIYNDTILGDPKGDKLRPNGLFALSVVPKKYIDATHAKSYLTRCEESLLGPLGMRTLAASDPDYNGWYNNSDDSCGYNYHNGPEWVWLFGHFVIACKKFSAFSDKEISAFMEPHARELKISPWRSLPELTNMNGNFCEFSCPSQAWSVCCLLEATEYLQQR